MRRLASSLSPLSFRFSSSLCMNKCIALRAVTFELLATKQLSLPFLLCLGHALEENEKGVSCEMSIAFYEWSIRVSGEGGILLRDPPPGQPQRALLQSVRVGSALSSESSRQEARASSIRQSFSRRLWHLTGGQGNSSFHSPLFSFLLFPRPAHKKKKKK